jgi:hypothetical protein
MKIFIRIRFKTYANSSGLPKEEKMKSWLKKSEEEFNGFD